jgi:hypothetical protein
MISRRALFAGTVATGFGAAPMSAATAGDDGAMLNSILSEVRAINAAIAVPGQAAVGQIKDARRIHVKNTTRFPEFLDVGIAVWEGAIEWLMALQQPVNTERNAEGRYTVDFLGTTLVLRPDYPDASVGQGYDR